MANDKPLGKQLYPVMIGVIKHTGEVIIQTSLGHLSIAKENVGDVGRTLMLIDAEESCKPDDKVESHWDSFGEPKRV